MLHLKMSQNQEKRLIYQRAALPSRGTSTGWTDGLAGALQCSTRSAESCTCGVTCSSISTPLPYEWLGTVCPERLWRLFPGDLQKPPGCTFGHPDLDVPAGAEVETNGHKGFSHFDSLWKTTMKAKIRSVKKRDFLFQVFLGFHFWFWNLRYLE